MNKQYLHQQITHEESVSEGTEKMFKDIGFHVWNASGDYIDLEAEVRFDNESEKVNYNSFNAHLTFDLTSKDEPPYLTLGVNEGEGWDDYDAVDFIKDIPFGDIVKEKIASNSLNPQYMEWVNDNYEQHSMLIEQLNQAHALLLKEVSFDSRKKIDVKFSKNDHHAVADSNVESWYSNINHQDTVNVATITMFDRLRLGVVSGEIAPFDVDIDGKVLSINEYGVQTPKTDVFFSYHNSIIETILVRQAQARKK